MNWKPWNVIANECVILDQLDDHPNVIINFWNGHGHTTAMIPLKISNHSTIQFHVATMKIKISSTNTTPTSTTTTTKSQENGYIWKQKRQIFKFSL